MEFAEITTPPPRKTLRQFAWLFLLVFGTMAGYRAYRGDVGTATVALGSVAIVVGVIGTISPSSIRYLYTSWMIAAFPIGWTLSQIVIALLFFAVFTPFAVVFKVMNRDALRLRKNPDGTYWIRTQSMAQVESYYSQY